ncbi:hypothetical protein [Mitsuokella jalaludinii]|uniref:hypothetical protein n=1 Tax=Mitsuokella jalaludinii TaxID=187979 RepID=UPI0020D13C1A|nr:hypothetical protein [Mitsuokella jalaludinii]MCQ1533185.1 hypothetical protein [Mitsuokella jalaludinii]
MANSREKKTRNVFTEKAALEQEIAALQAKLEEQAAKLADCRREIEDAIVARIKQRDELDALREENRQLRKRLALYEPPAQDEPPADAAGVPVEDSPAEPARTREEQEFFDSFRIYVVGGTEKWQKKAAEVFPTMHFLGSEKNFDRSALAQADYVIINTNAVSHACTEKAKNAAPKSASIIMTSNNNLHLLQRKLLETIQ